MRLADFIERDLEAILREWETFAGSQLPAAATMNALSLRDHAEQILGAVAKDLRTAQTRQQQRLKSHGLAEVLAGAPETAAQTHGLLRARSGFDIHQLAAEYRALRASVLRLWMDRCHPQAAELDDMVRFNEAIDQALAESIGFFTERVERARHLLLGMLAHDMRTPLQAVMASAQLLVAAPEGEPAAQAARRVLDGAGRIRSLLNDLLDLGRSQLGLALPVAPHETDLAPLLAQELDSLRTLYPQRELLLHCEGDCRGRWDGMRVQQLVENLVVNAVKYGDPGRPVLVSARGEPQAVVLEVRNGSADVDAERLATLFDPLRRGLADDADRRSGDGLGLGLYIAREIGRAHGGDVTVAARDGQTVFTCTLPRQG